MTDCAGCSTVISVMEPIHSVIHSDCICAYNVMKCSHRCKKTFWMEHALALFKKNNGLMIMCYYRYCTIQCIGLWTYDVLLAIGVSFPSSDGFKGVAVAFLSMLLEDIYIYIEGLLGMKGIALQKCHAGYQHLPIHCMIQPDEHTLKK